MFSGPDVPFRASANRVAAGFLSFHVHWLPSFLAFLVPIDYRFRLFEGMPSFTLAEVAAYSVALVYFAQVATGGWSFHGIIKNAYRENRTVFWYFGWVALSFLFGLARSENIVPIVKDLIPGLLFYVIVLLCVRTEQQVFSVIGCFLLCISINGILGVVQTMTNRYYIGEMHDIAFLKTDQYGDIVEYLAMGFFSHPNGYALFLIPGIFLVLFMVRHRIFPDRTRHASLLLLLALLVYNLLHTYSKGAIAWTALGVLLSFYLPRLGEKRFFPACMISIIGGIVAMVLSGALLFVYYSSAFGTTLGRLAYWWEGVNLLLGDSAIFLFGAGFDDMEAIMRSMFGITMNHAHNGYLNQALFHGVPAMMLFIAVVVGNLRTAAGRDNGGKWLGPGKGSYKHLIGACYVAYFGEYFFEPAQLGVNTQMLTFLIFAITAV
ncbi:MAG: O-antigen ligase domain-containing protein, partial [Deltaproteobacteria bacterium]